MERYRPYVDALWLFACLTCGDPVTADQVAVEAVVRACGDPTTLPPEGPWIWSTLVGNVERTCKELDERVRRAVAPTVAQREAVALVLAGRSPRDVASLLGIPLVQVHRALNGGLRALRENLPSRRPHEESARNPA